MYEISLSIIYTIPTATICSVHLRVHFTRSKYADTVAYSKPVEIQHRDTQQVEKTVVTGQLGTGSVPTALPQSADYL